MKKKTVALLCSLFAAAFFLAGFIGSEAVGSAGEGGQVDKGRADVIAIDALSRFGPLEESVVMFMHDKHTEAMAKLPEWSEKGCFTCHPADENGKMTLDFMKPLGESKAEAKLIYHDGCINCHVDLVKAGEKSGPTAAACRNCHRSDHGLEIDSHAVVVDRNLHYRHTTVYADDKQKCGVCHHQWDETAGKIVPAVEEKDVPGACVYCHKTEPTVIEGPKPVTVRTLRKAAHGECVVCHMERTTEPNSTIKAPFDCAGCHSASAQEGIAQRNQKAASEAKPDALRIKRGQPDAALVKGSVELSPEVKVLPMGVVPFNHKAHEDKVLTCVACHHASLDSCSSACHTVAGDAKGGFIGLEQAMHDRSAAQSCVGCHTQLQQDQSCIGCHGLMPGKPAVTEATCAPCHLKIDTAMLAGVKSQEDSQALAQMLIRARPAPHVLKAEDVPDIVTIDALVDKYEASKLPHRRIVFAMLDRIKDDDLAKTFHAAEFAVCASCHHNSPPSKNPPKCGSCHPAKTGGDATGRPGLMAAYHGQCMGCHTMMGIEGKVYSQSPDAKPVPAATDCTGCHKERTGVSAENN